MRGIRANRASMSIRERGKDGQTRMDFRLPIFDCRLKPLPFSFVGREIFDQESRINNHEFFLTSTADGGCCPSC